VRVEDHGAVGDGVTDDSSAIENAIAASVEGETIDFGAGKTYAVSRAIVLKGKRTYAGTSTVKLTAGSAVSVFRLVYPEEAITIDGLTLDAAGHGGGLRAGVGGGTSDPMDSVVVRNATIRNAAGDVSEAGIYAPAGFRYSTIENVKFLNCGTGIYVINVHHTKITGSTFDTTTGGNAISIVMADAPYAIGANVEISYNKFTNLKRMGIELYGRPAGDPLYKPIIKGNEFTAWNKAPNHDPYGISVVSGTEVQITDNIISGGVAGYAIEAGVINAYIARNTITGFPYGVVIQGQPDVTIEQNTFNRQTESGVILSNVRANPRARILNNSFQDCKRFAIEMIPNDYAGLLVKGNTISRQGGAFSDDGSITFGGIKLDAGLNGKVEVSDNTKTQTAAKPPAGFNFSGLRIFGGLSGSLISGNRFETLSEAQMGTGMVLWYGQYLNGATVTLNHFQKLNEVTNGYTSPSVLASQNTQCNVKKSDPNIITGTYCGQ
jgi:nitrous oxidase accessory protein NosD